MRGKRRTLSIKTTIILLYIIIMIVAAIGIASLIFTRWSASIERTLQQMAGTVNQQIYAQIQTSMTEPMHVIEANRKSIELGIVDISDENERNKFFIGVLTSQDEQIYSFSYGTVDGEYFGARRNEDGVVEIMRNDASTGGNSWYYSVNDDLSAGEIAVKLGAFDPRTRAWYQAAMEAGTGSFSPLYKHFVMDDLTVSAAWPVYQEEGKLHGVLGLHLLLSGMDSYLKETVDEYEGYTIIVEKDSGHLVANSMGFDNFTVLQDGALKRQGISEIQEQGLDVLYERYLASPDEQYFSIGRGRDRSYVDIRRMQMEGLDWLIISGIPGSLLLPQMFGSINLTVVLVAIALLVASVVCYLAIRTFFKPIEELRHVADSISAGDLTRRVGVKRDDEIGKISQSLNDVADKLQSFISNLETQVEARTEDLQVAIAELEEHKNSLRLILDSTAEGIYGIDLHGSCTFCNRSSLQLLGLKDPDELLGKHMHSLIHHSYPDGKPFPVEGCRIYRSIQTGTGYAAEDEVFWKADGSSFPVSYHSYPQYRNGQPIGGVITFMDITDRNQHDAQIEYLLSHDQLTGIHNRGYLEQQLPTLDIPENHPLSVIFADLNGLKMTNDIFGHAAGDELIKNTAQRLLRFSRQGDVVARVGGDEFMLLLPKTDEMQCEAIISKIRDGCEDTKNDTLKCSVSLGYAMKHSVAEKFEQVFSGAENAMYKEKSRNRNSIKKGIIATIIESLHARNEREKQHSYVVRDLCHRLGVEMDLSEEELNRLQRAAYVHDIGKITLDRDLLDKKQLSAEEHELFKRHPAVGYRILNLYDGTLDLADAVYSHHERWDGNGYPRGLHGEQIPLVARIIAVVETYERVLSRGDLSEPERRRSALQVIIDHAGTQFDPHVAKIFVHMMDERPIGEVDRSKELGWMTT